MGLWGAGRRSDEAAAGELEAGSPGLQAAGEAGSACMSRDSRGGLGAWEGQPWPRGGGGRGAQLSPTEAAAGRGRDGSTQPEGKGGRTCILRGFQTTESKPNCRLGPEPGGLGGLPGDGAPRGAWGPVCTSARHEGLVGRPGQPSWRASCWLGDSGNESGAWLARGGAGEVGPSVRGASPGGRAEQGRAERPEGHQTRRVLGACTR